MTNNIMPTCVSKGREVPEGGSLVRNEFGIDVRKILDSPQFELLQVKTHTFFAFEGEDYLSRSMHTQTVVNYSRLIARALGLNEELAEAIALGCDLGSTPFGYVGESVLEKACPSGFSHHKQSDRIAKELNLTWEVRDGILNHVKGCLPNTPEGIIVNYVDEIVAFNWLIGEAINTNQIPEGDLKFLESFGESRMDTVVEDMVMKSVNGIAPPMKRYIEIGETCVQNSRISTFAVKYQERARSILIKLIDSFIKNYKGSDMWADVCDYICSLPEERAVLEFEKLGQK